MPISNRDRNSPAHILNQINNGINTGVSVINEIARIPSIVTGTIATIDNTINTVVDTAGTVVNTVSNAAETISKAGDYIKKLPDIASKEVNNTINSFKNAVQGSVDEFGKSISNEVKNKVDSVLSSFGLSTTSFSHHDMYMTNSNKKEDNPQFLYKATVQFDGENQNVWDDTTNLAVMKYGGKAVTPSWLLVTNMTKVFAQQLKNDIKDGKRPKCTLSIYTVSTVNGKELKNLIFKKKMEVKKIAINMDGDMKSGTNCLVHMAMFSSEIATMHLRYTFNKTLSAKTAKEALDAYEAHLKANYGDIFLSKRIICNENTHRYNQLLTKPLSQNIKIEDGEMKYRCYRDSSIGLFLQNKYKIDNGYSIYFLDDFVVKEKKGIICYFVSFFDKNKLNKFDITSYQDILHQMQMLRSNPISDTNKVITKDNAVITHKLSNSAYSTTKTQKSQNTEGKVAPTSQKVVLSDDKRFFYGKTVTEVNKASPNSGEELTVNSTDNKELADKRLKIGAETILSKLDSIDEFVFFNTSPDWLEFGTVYNLNPSAPEEYNYTPIAFNYIFGRKDAKSDELKLMIRALFIKFKGSNAEKESLKTNPVPDNSASKEKSKSNVKS